MKIYLKSLPVIMLLIVGSLFQACNNDRSNSANKSERSVKSNIRGNNYAIVWDWKTDNEYLVKDYIKLISSEMSSLWVNNVIENVYYKSDTVNDLGYLPNITFFINAESEEDVEQILNNLVLVKKGLAGYSIFPVGTRWLGRKHQKVISNGLTRSYVAVWKSKLIDTEKDRRIIQAQADTILQLWKEGIIENVYFDVSDTRQQNNVTDFVFFINTNSKSEAERICNNLPFSVNEMATFKIFDVGYFWLGEHNK